MTVLKYVLVVLFWVLTVGSGLFGIRWVFVGRFRNVEGE